MQLKLALGLTSQNSKKDYLRNISKSIIEQYLDESVLEVEVNAELSSEEVSKVLKVVYPILVGIETEKAYTLNSEDFILTYGINNEIGQISTAYLNKSLGE